MNPKSCVEKPWWGFVVRPYLSFAIKLAFPSKVRLLRYIRLIIIATAETIINVASALSAPPPIPTLDNASTARLTLIVRSTRLVFVPARTIISVVSVLTNWKLGNRYFSRDRERKGCLDLHLDDCSCSKVP